MGVASAPLIREPVLGIRRNVRRMLVGSRTTTLRSAMSFAIS
jgi:hypothetical protein